MKTGFSRALQTNTWMEPRSHQGESGGGQGESSQPGLQIQELCKRVEPSLIPSVCVCVCNNNQSDVNVRLLL